MDSIKETLFKETYAAFKSWLELKDELGDWDSLVQTRYSVFRALYTVIEDSGMEKAYQGWKSGQK